MFDLDHAIAQWRRTMAAGGVDDSAVLDELETHLRDDIAQGVKSGASAEQAFAAGIARLGGAAELKREFVVAQTTTRFGAFIAILADGRKSFQASVALAALVALGFYGWKATVTPVFEAKATIQVFRRATPALSSGAPVMENDVRAAEDLNTILRLLESNRLRAQVAASLTPAEQKIIERTAVTSARFGDKLGVVKIIPMRLSLIVTIAVDHEDAEAAALVANRYTQECRRLLAEDSKPARAFIRVVDPAVPPRQRYHPNLTRVLVLSLMLGLATFAVALLSFAMLRKLLRTPTDLDPQMRIS